MNFFNQITVRVLKVAVLTITYLVLILLISSGLFLLMANFNLARLSHSIGVHPDIVGHMGLLCSIILSSIVLGFLILKINLKALDALSIAVLLVLFNVFVLDRSINNVSEHIDNILILLITPSIVFYIFKKYKKDTYITE